MSSSHDPHGLGRHFIRTQGGVDRLRRRLARPAAAAAARACQPSRNPVEALESRVLMHGGVHHEVAAPVVSHAPGQGAAAAAPGHNSHAGFEDVPTVRSGESRRVVGPHHDTTGHPNDGSTGTDDTHYFAETGDAHHFAWADKDALRAGTQIYYDYRAIGSYANLITAEQKAATEEALRQWSAATGGKVEFLRNATAADNDVIVIGTGDLAALGPYTSGPGGILGLGGGNFNHDDNTNTHSITGGVSWQDYKDKWDADVDTDDGNNPGTFDYFTVVAQEVGHALGLGHTDNVDGPHIMNGTYTAPRSQYTDVDKQHIQSVYGVAEPAPGTNSAPVANGDTATTENGKVLTVAAPGVLGNDTDANNDPLTVASFQGTSNLGAAVTVNADGSYTYDPRSSATLGALTAGQSAPDTFTYTASDGKGGTSEGTVTVTVTGPNSGTGPNVSYFGDSTLTKQVGSTVVDPDGVVSENWGSGSPAAGVPVDNFTVRWTGQVVAGHTGGYTFYAKVDDNVRLWVNGELVIRRWGSANTSEWKTSTQIQLEAGTKYTIQMDFREISGGASANLRWAGPSTAKQVIPKANLYTPAAGQPIYTDPYLATKTRKDDSTIVGVDNGDGTASVSAAVQAVVNAGRPAFSQVAVGGQASLAAGRADRDRPADVLNDADDDHGSDVLL